MSEQKLYAEEIALAMELKSDGVPYKFTAEYLGCNAKHLINTVRRCKKEGIAAVGFRTSPIRRVRAGRKGDWILPPPEVISGDYRSMQLFMENQRCNRAETQNTKQSEINWKKILSDFLNRETE